VIAKGEHETINVEGDTAVRGRPETDLVVINCHLMRSIGSVEVVQYMCTLFAIEYPPREDFEGGNYSATLVCLPRVRSIFGLRMLCRVAVLHLRDMGYESTWSVSRRRRLSFAISKVEENSVFAFIRISLPIHLYLLRKI